MKTHPDPPPAEFKDSGCGPGNFWTKLAPDLWFAPCCRQHDWDYFVGGTECDRVIADKYLRNCALARAPWWGKPLALLYHQAVKRFGGPFYPRREPRFPGGWPQGALTC